MAEFLQKLVHRESDVVVVFLGFVIADGLPKLGYLTWLDEYILITFAFIALVAIIAIIAIIASSPLLPSWP